MSVDLSSSVAVITGAGSGIGEACARSFAERGARVVVTDIDAARAERVAGEIGEQAVGLRVDVASTEDLEAARDLALERFGRVDVVMNNVGLPVLGAVEDIPLEGWQRLIDVNVLGMVRSNLVFLPLLIDQGSGYIINTASMGGLLPYGHDRLPYACPYLADRASGACSAVCVPVSIAGNTVGVVHATHTDGHPLDSQTIADVELISRKAGERIGMLRLLSRSETQAHTDPLTGLMNRRSLEVQVRDLVATGIPYVAAYGDLDLFKQLNDVYGHDAGDRALRLFARVLRDSMRPNDIPARYGGEEFVVVIPECTVADAYAILDRLRERLAAEQLGGTVPPFTVSFGLAASHPEMTFSETVERADSALLEAKSQGRDRIVIDGAQKPTTELDVLVPSPPLSGM